MNHPTDPGDRQGDDRTERRGQAGPARQAYAPDGEARRPTQVVRVAFSNPGEYLAELRQRGPNLEPLVRVTFRWTADASGAPVSHLTLLASYLRQVGEVVTVVQLARYVGTVWSGAADQASQRSVDEAQQRRTLLCREAKELGFEVATGAYVEEGTT